jgi:hypothetical protein
LNVNDNGGDVVVEGGSSYAGYGGDLHLKTGLFLTSAPSYLLSESNSRLGVRAVFVGQEIPILKFRIAFLGRQTKKHLV